MANAKERSYEVRFSHPHYPPVQIDSLTPERAANSVALMHPAMACHLDGVCDLATRQCIRFVGRCRNPDCNCWIRSTEKHILSRDRKGFECGECRP